MISRAPASMVGGGPGRCQDSVRAPVKKVARRRQAFLRLLGRIARIRRAKRASADSRMEKIRRCAVRIPAAAAKTGGISGSRT
jgi:hypothetical protein